MVKAMLAALLWCLCSCSDTEPSAPARRTILVYAVACNSLSSFLPADMEEMEKGLAANVADAQNCRWLVYVADYSSDPALWELKMENGTVTRHRCKKYSDEEASTTPRRLSRVIADVQHIAPANDYGLILWSHGAGWNPAHNIGTNKYWFGDDLSQGTATQHLDITDMAQAIPKGTFSFIWADCCHLGGIETAYELSDRCSRFIGYPTEVLGQGMPYHLTVPFLLREQADVEGAAKAFYDYYNAKSGQQRAASVCVVNTSRLPALAAACRSLMNGRPTPQLGSVQRFHREETGLGPYYDLRDLCKAFAGGDVNDVRYRAVCQALDEAVTYAAATPAFLELRIAPDRFCGLSSYLLMADDPYSDFYRQYRWCKDVFE